MSKEKKNKMTPRLRFPEFREAGEWEQYQLGELFSERQETGFIELPLLSLTEKDGIIPQEDTKRKNNSSSDKSKYLRICPGDIAYNTMRMWEGRSAFVDKEGLVSPAYTICKPQKSADGLFFSFYFKTPRLIKEFHRYSQGLVKDTLNLKFNAFSKILAFTPKINEQQKIAAILTSLDDLITAQTEKIKALQAHKKGLMQQLFPVEGERVPRVRFEEFRDAGEWEERTLGDENIARFVTKKTPLEKLNLDSYISTENLLPDYGGVTPASKLPPSGTFTQFQIGDILISNIRPYLKKVWAAEKEGTASNDIIIIRAVSTINKTFLSFLLKNDCFITYVMGGAKGLKMPRGDKSLIKEYRIGFPEKAEQQKIAATLTSLDDLITAHTQKLEALKGHKKGLMQQLFPNTNENDS